MVKRRPPQFRLSPETVRKSALGIIIVIALFFAVRGFLSFVEHSELFIVKEIALPESLESIDIPELSKLKGKNIFAVSVGKVETSIRKKYPALAGLRVLRRLPDQIVVTAVKRTPFARVQLQGVPYLADRDGFLIRIPDPDDGSLPLVKGLNPQKPALGEAIKDARLSTAFQIIEFFRQDKMLAAVPLRSVDISDMSRIVCAVGNEEVAGIDLILAAKNFRSGVRILGMLLSNNSVNLLEVKYIDLRFEEPLFGKKKAKRS